MTNLAKRDLIAQWAFDTRPVLLRFHLWLEDVEVERAQAEPVSAHTFAPRGIARCLAMTSAATALGTRLFGDYGGGCGERVRDERGPLAPHANAAGEPRVDGLARRRPDAEGRRDARDGRQSDARLRTRLRAARIGEDRRSPRAAAAERDRPHVRAIPRVAQEPRHHAVGRG